MLRLYNAMYTQVVTPEDMMNAYEVNCVAPLFISRGFLPLLQKAADNAHKKDMGADRAAIIQMSTIMASFQDDPSGGNAYAYRFYYRVSQKQKMCGLSNPNLYSAGRILFATPFTSVV